MPTFKKYLIPKTLRLKRKIQFFETLPIQKKLESFGTYGGTWGLSRRTLWGINLSACLRGTGYIGNFMLSELAWTPCMIF